MQLNLADKSVIVTGGGSNIGRAIVHAFARERAHVTIAEIDETTGRDGGRRGPGSREPPPHPWCAPTSRAGTACTALVREVEARRGGIDVLVNNVGWTLDAPFLEKEREDWEREVQLNLWGAINCTRAVLDGMVARKSGAIVSLGSDAGPRGPVRRGGLRGLQGRHHRAQQEPGHARSASTASDSTWCARA